jgi:hypothetical protein
LSPRPNLQTSDYDAEVSRTGGGTFNTSIKSGTNDLHGSAVGHIRETDWLANNFFANKAGDPRPNSPFKDFAFSFGGPIVIPKLYHGHNKTFFFASDEPYRETDGSTTVLSVPTALELQGNFSQTYNKNGQLQTIYNPLSTNLSTGTRTPFPNNIIPPSLQNPVGRALASYYPTASAAYCSQPNYNFTGSYPRKHISQCGDSGPGLLLRPQDRRHRGQCYDNPRFHHGDYRPLGFQPFLQQKHGGECRLQPGFSGTARIARRRHHESGFSGDHHERLFELRRRHRRPGCLLFAQFQCDRVQIPPQAYGQGRFRLPHGS